MKVKNYLFILLFMFLVPYAYSQIFDSQVKKGRKNYYVMISTNYGDMVVKLYNETPNHRDNFVKLVREGFYDSLLFHRVIQNFMIQGGDKNSKYAAKGQPLGDGSLNYTVPAEFVDTLIHKKGALAAARQGDMVNPTRASSSCQFYIVQGNVWNSDALHSFATTRGISLTQQQIDVYTTVGGTPHLDGAYTVFGEVVYGLDVLDKIASVSCDGMDRPVEDVRFSMKLMKKAPKIKTK